MGRRFFSIGRTEQYILMHGESHFQILVDIFFGASFSNKNTWRLFLPTGSGIKGRDQSLEIPQSGMLLFNPVSFPFALSSHLSVSPSVPSGTKALVSHRCGMVGQPSYCMRQRWVWGTSSPDFNLILHVVSVASKWWSSHGSEGQNASLSMSFSVGTQVVLFPSQ